MFDRFTCEEKAKYREKLIHGHKPYILGKYRDPIAKASSWEIVVVVKSKMN